MMSLPTSSMEGGKRAPPRVGAFFNVEIDPRHGEIILFGCCLSSGLVDSTTYNGVVQVSESSCNSTLLMWNSLQDIRVDADGYVQIALGLIPPGRLG
jgi:hypothetical protein